MRIVICTVSLIPYRAFNPMEISDYPEVRKVGGTCHQDQCTRGADVVNLYEWHISTKTQRTPIHLQRLALRAFNLHFPVVSWV